MSRSVPCSAVDNSHRVCVCDSPDRRSLNILFNNVSELRLWTLAGCGAAAHHDSWLVWLWVNKVADHEQNAPENTVAVTRLGELRSLCCDNLHINAVMLYDVIVERGGAISNILIKNDNNNWNHISHASCALFRTKCLLTIMVTITSFYVWDYNVVLLWIIL